jgi:hypothetical protein
MFISASFESMEVAEQLMIGLLGLDGKFSLGISSCLRLHKWASLQVQALAAFSLIIVHMK